jgi:hypothetical protein
LAGRAFDLSGFENFISAASQDRGSTRIESRDRFFYGRDKKVADAREKEARVKIGRRVMGS